MHLLLVRHGIAHDRTAPDCPIDSERPLTELGLRRSVKAMTGLATMGIPITKVISSPYRRAHETAVIVAEAFGLDCGAVQLSSQALPDRSPAALAATLKRLPAQGCAVIGHSPHLDLLLGTLVTGQPLRLGWLKKSSAALLVREGRNFELAWIMPPRALRRLAG